MNPSKATRKVSATGLRQCLDPEHQHSWMEGETRLRDADERSESLEQRFKYIARYEKLLRRPQAQDVLQIVSIASHECERIARFAVSSRDARRRFGDKRR